MQNNFRIIGGINLTSSLQAKKKFINLFEKNNNNKLIEAEIAKLAENTFRLVNISLANEMNKICEKHNIKSKVFKITNLHQGLTI